MSETLRAFIWSHPGPLIILGDFNQVEYSTQKLGGNLVLQGANDFSSWKLDCKLIELPFHRVPFTWTNKRENEDVILERLDRAYYNDAWNSKFSNAFITNYPIFVLDHGPIIL